MDEPEKYNLEGHVVENDIWNNVKVYLDGELLHPSTSLQVINHSPDGFSWGYSGSGPSQLALAIAIELYGTEAGLDCYLSIRDDVIAHLPQNKLFDINFWSTPEGWLYEHV